MDYYKTKIISKFKFILHLSNWHNKVYYYFFKMLSLRLHPCFSTHYRSQWVNPCMTLQNISDGIIVFCVRFTLLTFYPCLWQWHFLTIHIHLQWLMRCFIKGKVVQKPIRHREAEHATILWFFLNYIALEVTSESFFSDHPLTEQLKLQCFDPKCPTKSRSWI